MKNKEIRKIEKIENNKQSKQIKQIQSKIHNINWNGMISNFHYIQVLSSTVKLPNHPHNSLNRNSKNYKKQLIELEVLFRLPMQTKLLCWLMLSIHICKKKKAKRKNDRDLIE